MDLRVTVKTAGGGAERDISALAFDISVSTRIRGQAGSMSFRCLPGAEALLSEGGAVSLYSGGRGVFYGYIFSSEVSKDGVRDVLCLDQLRYLSNRGFLRLEASTCGGVFRRVCAETKLRHLVASDSKYVLPPQVADGMSYYEMISQAIDATMSATGAQFFIRDDFGTLRHAELKKSGSDVTVPRGAVISSSAAYSIGDDTYNSVVLVKDGREGPSAVSLSDRDGVARWGLLQYFGRADRLLTDAQIKEQAGSILKSKDRRTESVRLSAFGDFRVFAGARIFVDGPAGEAASGEYTVEACSHSAGPSGHTMSLSLSREA